MDWIYTPAPHPLIAFAQCPTCTAVQGSPGHSTPELSLGKPRAKEDESPIGWPWGTGKLSFPRFQRSLCLLSNAPFSGCQDTPHNSPTPPSVPGLPQGRNFNSNFSKGFRPGNSEGGVDEVGGTIHSEGKGSVFTDALMLGRKAFRGFQIQGLNKWSKGEGAWD